MYLVRGRLPLPLVRKVNSWKESVELFLWLTDFIKRQSETALKDHRN